MEWTFNRLTESIGGGYYWNRLINKFKKMINPFEKPRKTSEETGAEKAEIPKDILEDIDRALDSLAKIDKPELQIEEQCLSRFGMNWADVQREMHKRILRAKLELLPGAGGKKPLEARLDYKQVLEALHEFTGNWMTKNFIEALYLNYSNRFEGSSVSENIDKLRQKKYIKGSDKRTLPLLEMAPVVNPDKVKEVLAKYNTDIPQ